MPDTEKSVLTVGLTGLATGIALGGLFGLAVVSFADCAGADCTYQRIVGVVGHAAGGGVAGGIAGLLGHTCVRFVRQYRDRRR